LILYLRVEKALPLYAYRCTQCGHRFEKIQNFSAEPELICPQCNGQLERPLTAPRLHFKGAGWYVNDYASKSSELKVEGTSDSAPSDKSAPASAEAKTPAKASESSTTSSTTPSTPASTSTPSSTSS
jgi:putative FmdB family regulatory protein